MVTVPTSAWEAQGIIMATVILPAVPAHAPGIHTTATMMIILHQIPTEVQTIIPMGHVQLEGIMGVRPQPAHTVQEAVEALTAAVEIR